MARIIRNKMSSFLEEERRANLARFGDAFPRIVEMLEEIKSRLPWQRQLVASLTTYIEAKGELTPKQRSLVTSLYLDNCVKSDIDIQEQIDCRKLLLRLGQTKLGKVEEFIRSVILYTYDKPFSPLQMKGVRNIAKRYHEQLESVPEVNESNFDGWNFVGWIEPEGEE